MFNEEWIASLKVGDEVAYSASGFSGRQKVIAKVESITPGGKIRTETGYLFNKNGSYKIDKWTCYHLIPVTNEIRQEAKKRAILAKIYATKFEEWPLEKLERMYVIIKE